MTTETKKLEWETEDRPSVTSATLRFDSDLMLSVSPAADSELESGTHWHYFQLAFGRHMDRPQMAGQALWPREAIQIARQKLDEFESQLDAAGK